jgi:hypothetical protein
MGASAALFILLAVWIPTAAQAQNFTSSSSNNVVMKIGWQNSPNQRGTLTILWSCLSTIIACTWTILHLNVPGTSETNGYKILRKAKWMLVTILFPEFLFSKAVCELQMAIDDLNAMAKKKELLGSKFQWRVEFGGRLQILYNLFHFFSKGPVAKLSGVKEKETETKQGQVQKSDKHTRKQTGSVYPSPNLHDPQDWTHEERTWTLAHSYFANMGGLQRHHPRPKTLLRKGGSSCKEEIPNPITAYALVNCCVGSDHDPLPALYLEKDDIDDKAKADWFLKSIAIAQIFWLLLSVIVRAGTRMPITQLEICTSAFSLLAIATYIANWSKPKDVGTPIRFKISADTYQCEAWKYYGEPYLRRLYWPSQSGKHDIDGPVIKPLPECTRIENDFVRLEGFLPPMNITMAISTAIFGGLHSLAWYFSFPTKTEMMIWMVASVLSATIPLATLLANIIVIGRIHKTLSEFGLELSEKISSFEAPGKRVPVKPSSKLPPSLSKLRRGHYTVRACPIGLHVRKSPLTQLRAQQLATDLYTFYYNLTNFICWKIRLDSVFSSYAQLEKFPVLHNSHLIHDLRQNLSSLDLEPFEVDFLLFFMRSKESKTYMVDKKRALKAAIDPSDTAGRVITSIGGILYASVRLIILTLAFCALRYVPEEVYTTSWTRFLPHIS